MADDTVIYNLQMLDNTADSFLFFSGSFHVKVLSAIVLLHVLFVCTVGGGEYEKSTCRLQSYVICLMPNKFMLICYVIFHHLQTSKTVIALCLVSEMINISI